MVLTTYQKNKLKSLLIRKTSEMKFPDTLENKGQNLGERHRAIQEALDEGNWGCQKDSVYSLISAVVGEEFPTRDNRNSESLKCKPLIGAVVVYDSIGAEDKDRGYPTGIPIYVAYVDNVGDGSGWFLGQKDSESPDSEDRCWLPSSPSLTGDPDTRIRPATESEITSLVNQKEFIQFITSRMLIL